jgi:hypothetical protein
MKQNFVWLLTILVLTGCSTYAVDRYSISADNVVAFRSLGENKLSVGEFTSFKPGLKEIMCRGVGPIKTFDGNTFVDFIKEALIDELQIAEVYSSEAPIILTGHLENIDFSSNSGQWNLSLTVKSSNGQTTSVTEEYKYTTSFYGETACNQTAQALMPAVQNLINKVVTDQNFSNLLR